MNLKSIIITSFAFISIVSCKPDTKDYEKKLANDQQKLDDAVNQIEKDVATFKKEAIFEYYKLTYNFLNYKEPKDCEIYKEEMDAFLERGEQLEKNILKKADERNTSISYRIFDLVHGLKKDFVSTYYKKLSIKAKQEGCEKKLSRIL